MSIELTAAHLAARLDALGDPAHAEILQRFFQTGPGGYAEGDEFIGVRVPATRTVVKEFAALPAAEATALLASPVHEHRLAALLVLVAQAERAARTGDDDARRKIFDLYLAAVSRGEVDNWDLVDSTAEQIVGRWLREQDDVEAFARLDRLAAGPLWERRVAVIATFAWIKAGDAEPTLRLAETLLGDREPLIHKAVGWMLREVGKRVDRGELLAFLEENAGRMPRTMLSSAVEHLAPSKQARLRAIPRRPVRSTGEAGQAIQGRSARVSAPGR
ncbi:DNA alkylation repair protein [Microbacterium sp. P02]|uniref:DNA alkylation repair protein n=1 Tax=Microbacterium sp. P02 TaxID=3366260 RepID=UPI0036734153